MEDTLLFFNCLLVNFGIEENQKTKWSDSKDSKSAPTVVQAIHGMCSHVRQSNVRYHTLEI